MTMNDKSPYEWKILERDEKPQTNKQTKTSFAVIKTLDIFQVRLY